MYHNKYFQQGAYVIVQYVSISLALLDGFLSELAKNGLVNSLYQFSPANPYYLGVENCVDGF